MGRTDDVLGRTGGPGGAAGILCPAGRAVCERLRLGAEGRFLFAVVAAAAVTGRRRIWDDFSGDGTDDDDVRGGVASKSLRQAFRRRVISSLDSVSSSLSSC